MKLNKKKVILIISILIVIVLATIFIVYKINHQKEDGKIGSKNIESISIEENSINIKSTKEKPIEKDGIEAENIQLNMYGDQLEVKATLKNNTKEALNGYLVEIDLLDAEENVLTTVADSSQDVIEAGKSAEITSYVMGLENQDQIRSARIKEIQKQNVRETLEQQFTEMTPEEVENAPSSEEITPDVVGPQQSE